MANTNTSQFVLNRPLTAMSIKRGLGETGAGTRIAPIVPGNDINGLFFKRDRQRIGQVDIERAPGQKVARTGTSDGEMEPYLTKDHSIIKEVPLELVEGQAYRELFQELDNAAKEALAEVQFSHEKKVNSTFWASDQAGFEAIYGASAVQTPSTKWDAAGGEIFNDTKALSDTIYKRCGHRPNTMVLTNQVLSSLQGDPNNEIGERLKYTNGNVPTTQLLAQYFSEAGITNVIVPNTLQDTANAGQAESYDYLWTGDNVGLFYVDPRITRNKETLSTTFTWSNPRKPFLGVLTRYNEDIESYEAKVSAYFDVKVVDNACGGIIFDCLT